MSHPFYNGGLKGALTADNRPYLADDGNWSLEGQTEGPVYRSVALYVDGALVFGFFPDWRAEDFAQAIARAGCYQRPAALAWVGPILQPGQTAEIRVKAGNRYVGWGDSAGLDKMEWGSGDPSNPSSELLASSGPLIVPTPAPAPPPPPPLPPAPPEPAPLTGDQLVAKGFALIAEGIKAWRTAGVPDTAIARTKANAATVLKALPTSDPRVAEVQKILAGPA